MASYYQIIEKAVEEFEAQGWALHSQSCLNRGRRRQVGKALRPGWAGPGGAVKKLACAAGSAKESQ